jgi:chaperonin GroES
LKSASGALINSCAQATWLSLYFFYDRDLEGENYMKIRPLHDRIVIRRLDEERKTASGIVIPDSAAEKPDQGEVVAVGKGKMLEDGKVRPIDLKTGDRVLFGKYSGQTVKVEGEELLVMREDDVMGVLDAA